MSASGDAAPAIAEAARSAGFIPGHRVPCMLLAPLDDPRMLELPGLGFHLGLIDAFPDGLPLYERMGFQHAMEMQSWSLA